MKILATIVVIFVIGCVGDGEGNEACNAICETATSGACYAPCDELPANTIDACVLACAKDCTCGTNLCGNGPNGANYGCVRGCLGITGRDRFVPRSQAYLDCMATSTCDEITNADCAAL